jgi:shikimate dehydrogenase
MGYPIAHSLSPLMQTFAFQYHHLDSLYVPFPVMPEHVASAVAGAVALGVCGFNVTIPHKEAIMPYLDEVSTEARFIGAVNTVRIHEGRAIGYNTDGAGFLQPLRSLALTLTEMSVCMIGAGGAARAIAMALLQSGCPFLTIANRTYERGRRLVKALQKYVSRAEIRAVPYEQVAEVASRSTLVVNATSLGLHRQDTLPLPETCFRAGQVVYDIVYRPLETPLLKAAQRRGATIVPGIDMLIGQGAEAFHIWTGLTFPVQAIRRTLEPLLHEAFSDIG